MPKSIAVVSTLLDGRGGCPNVADAADVSVRARIAFAIGDVPLSPEWDLRSVADVSDYYRMLNRTLVDLAGTVDAVLFISPGYSLLAEDFARLVAALDADFMQGFAVARTLSGGSAPLPHLAGQGGAADDATARGFLQRLSATGYGGVVHAPPVLVRSSMLQWFGPLRGTSPNLNDALARLYIRANRRGYGAVVANHALVTGQPVDGVSEVPTEIDNAGDYTKAYWRRQDLPEIRMERLLWNAMRPKDARVVVFDIRNLAPGFNGTAQHIMALMGPLCELAPAAEIEPLFWVTRAAVEFHGLEARFPGKLMYDLPPDPAFDACVRLSQPWSFSELRDLARISLVNLYFMLDAIAWDCHYIRMRHLDGTWRSLASTADGFLFNSGFTRDAFVQRFPDASKVPLGVSYCSLDPQEYLGEDPAPRYDTPYVLVVGNHYHHKGLEPAVQALSASFPHMTFKVLGSVSRNYANVEQIASGQVAEVEVDALHRDAIAIVFPSYYEGFGLPVLKGLCYGKPVIARQSPLLDELRNAVAPVQGIVPFHTQNQFLRAVHDAIQNRDVLRAQRNQAVRPSNVYGWRNAAAAIMELLDRSFRDFSPERCLRRLNLFYAIDQFDAEREGWANSEQNRVIFEVELEE